MTISSRFPAKILISAVLLFSLQSVAFSDEMSTFEQRGTWVAEQWMNAFKKLDARNKITMVLSNNNAYYEIEDIVSMEASGYFLIVRSQTPSGLYFFALVNPNTIMLVKETPRLEVKKK